MSNNVFSINELIISDKRLIFKMEKSKKEEKEGGETNRQGECGEGKELGPERRPIKIKKKIEHKKRNSDWANFKQKITGSTNKLKQEEVHHFRKYGVSIKNFLTHNDLDSIIILMKVIDHLSGYKHHSDNHYMKDNEKKSTKIATNNATDIIHMRLNSAIERKQTTIRHPSLYNKIKPDSMLYENKNGLCGGTWVKFRNGIMHKESYDSTENLELRNQKIDPCLLKFHDNIRVEERKLNIQAIENTAEYFHSEPDINSTHLITANIGSINENCKSMHHIGCMDTIDEYTGNNLIGDIVKYCLKENEKYEEMKNVKQTQQNIGEENIAFPSIWQRPSKQEESENDMQYYVNIPVYKEEHKPTFHIPTKISPFLKAVKSEETLKIMFHNNLIDVVKMTPGEQQQMIKDILESREHLKDIIEDRRLEKFDEISEQVRNIVNISCNDKLTQQESLEAIN